MLDPRGLKRLLGIPSLEEEEEKEDDEEESSSRPCRKICILLSISYIYVCIH